MTSLHAPLLIAVVAGMLPSPQVTAQPFSQIIVFGDSNVDAGYYKMLSSPGGGTTYNNLWPTAVAHGAGAPTTSPGLVYPQYLAAYFGLTANPSNATGGTNYATSGAKNVMSNGSANGGFTAAIPTHNQISNYLSAHGGVADSQALYVIHSGDNDVSFAAGDSGSGPFPSNPDDYVIEAAEDLGGDILILKNAGAQHIVVAGLAYDYPTGNGADAVNRRALKLLYTQTLFQNLTQIAVPYYPADLDKMRLAISANPANYGFTSIGTATVACTQPTGVSSAWALLCSSNSAAPSTWTAPGRLTNLFADDQHLATAGQRLMARFVRNLVVPWTATHDFGGLGKSGIPWRDGNGNVVVWEMSGTNVVNPTSTFVGNAAVGTWTIIGIGDFNSDGKSDFLWRDTSGNVAIWLMNGTQILKAAGVALVTGWSVIGIGDFDGDGKSDLLWTDGNGNYAIWEMNGTTVLNPSASSVGHVASPWSVIGTGDFNGDGMSDILWTDGSGNYAIWEMNGTTVLNPNATGVGRATGWSVVRIGDYNGDQMSDLLWTDGNGNYAIWEMNGRTVINPTATYVGFVASPWSIAGTGDYNGDGMSDILWTDNSGNYVIWEMNGTTVFNPSATGVGHVATNWAVQLPLGQ